MNRLDWRSDPDFLAETTPDFERYIITSAALEQERAQLEQEEKALQSLPLWVAMALLHSTHPIFLPLPKRLAIIEQDEQYYLACLQGRLSYRMDQCQFDEVSGQTVSTPTTYTRQQIGVTISTLVRLPDDIQLAATIPLAFRVGYAVGWLSALAVSQKEDARAGLVALSALVAPLLCPVPARRSADVQRCRPGRLPAPRSSKQHKQSVKQSCRSSRKKGM